jgi:hypothetical protein
MSFSFSSLRKMFPGSLLCRRKRKSALDFSLGRLRRLVRRAPSSGKKFSMNQKRKGALSLSGRLRLAGCRTPLGGIAI